MSNGLITAVLVDDEKKACINLSAFLSEYAGTYVKVIGMANNTANAEKMIAELKPDAVFIDIDMPKENAFQFLNRLGDISFEVIFVTAYDHYAVKAFRLNAVDYILKPIDIDELLAAVEKLTERVRYNNLFKSAKVSYKEMIEQLNKKTDGQKIRLKSVNRSELVDFNDIYFIEAQGSYSRIVFAKGNDIAEIIMSNPLSDYEELLPPSMYYRSHKTYLVNCRHVSKIISDDNSYVVLSNNLPVPVSRRRILPLKQFLKSNGYFV